MSALPEMRAEIDATDALTERIRVVMGQLIAERIERGAALYDRARHLAPLIGDWQHLSDAEIVQRLERKLRQMQRLTAVTGHWTGDANRVIALRQALEGEHRDAG